MNSVVLVNEYSQHIQNVPPIKPTAPPMEIIQSIQEEERNIVRENGYLTGEIYLRVGVILSKNVLNCEISLAFDIPV